MGVDLRSLSDEELERLIAQIDQEEGTGTGTGTGTPPPPDALPGANHSRDTTPEPKSTGNPAIDAALGAGSHFANSALSVGETMRSIPGVGKVLRGAGDIAARVFGLPDPGIVEEETLEGRIAAERGAIDHVAPHNTAAEVGAGGAALAETLIPLLATGGGAAITRGGGIMAALRQASKQGLKEAALTGVTSGIQEGKLDEETAGAMAFSGSMPMIGRGATALKSGASDLVAKSLLTTPREAVKRGGSAVRGLKNSGVIASGVESLWNKLDDAAQKSTEKTLKFLQSRDIGVAGATGSARTFDRRRIIDIIKEEKDQIWADSVMDTQLKDAAIKKLDGVKREFMGNRYIKKSGAAKGKVGYTPRRVSMDAEELIQLRRKLGKIMSITDEDPKSATKIVNSARQSMYQRINHLLEEQIPEIADLNKADYDILTARDAAETLLGQKVGSHNEFIVRRALPLMMGGVAGYAAGGSPGATLAGLGAGAALGSPATATALVQGLKTREGTRMAEILARLFGATPGLTDDDEDRE